ncbi:hypothetical protein OAK47_01240 [Planctomycetaceae bacterium]|nr:hypothetical protein [bacterium]MDC0261824.1 hypothetical protein [Planctomycetaceae bacterium]MDC0274198.1 hypothetical protein [Planctomycetaceae bacterium]MDC0307933.1 hypothetical protein [Planctomycetaceae bacterium]MDG2390180.1 hypothetical protein [Planctomycetaceae bacterium]
MTIPTLCDYCRHRKLVISGKGSRFLMCQKSSEDKRYPKYPPQPVVECAAFDRDEPSTGSTD